MCYGFEKSNKTRRLLRLGQSSTAFKQVYLGRGGFVRTKKMYFGRLSVE